MTGSELTFFSMSYQRQSFDFSRRRADRNSRAISCEPNGNNKPLYAMPVTRPGMHMNEVSMNAPIKEGRRSRFRGISVITYLLRISPRILRRRESCESNECHKVARRRTAIAVKLCGMTGETTRCCRIVGANARGFRGLIFSFNRVLR